MAYILKILWKIRSYHATGLEKTGQNEPSSIG